jgi:hypothetical protein
LRASGFIIITDEIFYALLQVEMEEMLTKNRYLYNCDRWLADDEDDHECVREMPATGPNIDRPLPCMLY